MSISLQPLLERITLLNKKYEGVAEITGENYNIFRILQVESSEVRLHSAFIANLLDPKASHGQKKSFLKAFIEEFKITRSANIDSIDVEINVEEFIGNKNEDCTSGGRIDIVVKANNEAIIVIENKIYAEDQLKQLIRYNNRYPNAKLLYLTLDGCEPDDSSIKNDNGTFLKSGEDFFCVSYKRDVLNWLKLCKEKAVNHPLLRETITQYINLIKHLTNHMVYPIVRTDNRVS